MLAQEAKVKVVFTTLSKGGYMDLARYERSSHVLSVSSRTLMLELIR
ncbi:hypothetical protein [Sulfuracidifex metallicus]|nr:hypothetical protein [Sulfuracidifex metallicus]MCY0851096.1 hypothetical protein [Sulfuracidifex metallicus]BBL47292.1 hypothetical protein MJ1HA_1393 [Metallosphaera sedula]